MNFNHKDSQTRRIQKSVIILLLLCLLFFNSAAFGLTSKVILSSNEAKFALKVSNILTEILNSLELQDWEPIKPYFSTDGYEGFIDLMERTQCRNVNPLYEGNILTLPQGGFEVRDIKVKVDMKETPGNNYQYLIFDLNPSGIVTDVRFGMENWHYQEIIKTGERLKDFAFRQQIIQFLEIFRTAYNRKDLDFLSKVYSEDALIIVGKVLREKKGEADMLEKSTLSKDNIVFIKKSKKEYIRSLVRVFKLNEFIKIRFDEVEVRKHPSIELIYGVTLKQNWHTSTYSDEGYLFLMIDYRIEGKPIIHVRSWQRDKFPDDTVVNLGYFDIIE